MTMEAAKELDEAASRGEDISVASVVRGGLPLDILPRSHHFLFPQKPYIRQHIFLTPSFSALP